MSRYRVNIGPAVPESERKDDSWWQTAAAIGRAQLAEQGITTYRPVIDRWAGADSRVIDGVTVLMQYNIMRGEWLRCVMVETDAKPS